VDSGSGAEADNREFGPGRAYRAGGGTRLRTGMIVCQRAGLLHKRRELRLMLVAERRGPTIEKSGIVRG